MGFFIGVIMCINKNEELLPYYERAKEVLNYNEQTGIFVRFIKSRNTYEEAGVINGSGYRQISISVNGNRKILRAHRLAWFMAYGELPNIIDHIDHNKLNNRISNLRSCTHQQNKFNQGKYSNNTSGFKGVSFRKPNKKWMAQIAQDGKIIYLGSFNCPQEASRAYEAKARELFGDYYSSII
tara:strand:+ start:270 stop:815 length:546 start_codon:yes stop_codon:yes gene_type:complete